MQSNTIGASLSYNFIWGYMGDSGEVKTVIRVSDLRSLEVINIEDGRRLGTIRDIDLDLKEGKVKAIVLPGSLRFLGLFGRRDDLVVSWQQIKKIGVDVILVELNHGADSKWHHSR